MAAAPQHRPLKYWMVATVADMTVQPKSGHGVAVQLQTLLEVDSAHTLKAPHEVMSRDMRMTTIGLCACAACWPCPCSSEEGGMRGLGLDARGGSRARIKCAEHCHSHPHGDARQQRRLLVPSAWCKHGDVGTPHKHQVGSYRGLRERAAAGPLGEGKQGR
jgi:hypothetical protein